MDTLNQSVYLSTAYLAPVQYYCKLVSYGSVVIEAEENYRKQTYRNRCVIAGANGLHPLSVPIEKPQSEKCLTKDIRISDHGNWRHLHWHALVSAYGMSPFFEYYQDDFAPFYENKFDFLMDLNEQFRQLICELVDIEVKIQYSAQYQPTVENDYRETIRPKHPGEDLTFNPTSYYQVFQDKYGFFPNISIIDLLFNMGSEALLVLIKSSTATPFLA